MFLDTTEVSSGIVGPLSTTTVPRLVSDKTVVAIWFDEGWRDGSENRDQEVVAGFLAGGKYFCKGVKR